MKTKTTFKSLLAIIGLLLSFNLQAQDVPSITIHVENAGSLSSFIAESKKYQIINLTLTGNLNGIDIRYIREMAGRDYIGNATNGKLTILNLADANIISGGGAYYHSGNNFSSTSNNSFGEFAFYNCTRLTSVILPNSLILIETAAFQGCTGLTSVIIPDSVTSIGSSAFQGCTGLTSVIIPNSVTSIGSSAFQSCTKLTAIKIPKNITSIEATAFRGCTGLKEFIVLGENANYSTIDGVLFNKDRTTLIAYPNAKATTYTIPNSVTSIGAAAFQRCTGLISIIIPVSVTSIGAFSFPSAFQDCTGLTEIHCKNPTPPKIASYEFSVTIKQLANLYVPKGSYSTYWLAVGWGDFVNIIEEDATAINTISKDKIAINTIANGIAIATKETTLISIVNISGQKVYQSTINGNAEILLNKGVYIVKVNNESQKIIIQ
ncbi:MAG: leucine-rich repeat domain-containing protein [Candidatus Symbiothrix sp.]|jgi:hypothetical protein|nr:leucine-rich repeat domain-containing protein [Candidatus Symbiothrix sp.]